MGTPDRPDAATILAAMEVGYLRLDPDGQVTQMNAAAERILGDAADVLGHDVGTTFPGSRDSRFEQACETVLRTGQPESFEANFPDLAAWFEIRVQPAQDGVACYVLDVTARHRADERAARSAARNKLVGAVSQALAGSLDVVENLAKLAELVVPYLGSWSIVSVVSETGTLTDVGSWHLDPALRTAVASYAGNRLQEYIDEPFAMEAVRTGEPRIISPDAGAIICAALRPGLASRVLGELRPQLCAMLPMVAGGRAVGLLSVYADSAWTADQRATADDIVARAALAIDNSLAYGRAQAARRQAETINERLALLAQVSGAMASREDPDEAVARVVDLLVPQLADWCVLTMVEEQGALRDVAVAHRDPRRAADVETYVQRHLDAITDASTLATVLRTGEPMIIPRMTDQIITDSLTDPDAAAVVRRLDPYGVAAFPLIARGRTFGVLALITTSSRGSHRDDEVATGLEVARRLAPVLDGVRTAAQARQLAESIQRSLLQIGKPAPGLRVATRYRAAYHDRDIGGDWYDVFPLPDGSTTIAIGDVMGHDLVAMAAMAQLRTLMRATAWTLQHSPAETLAGTEEASAALGPGTFATAFMANLAPSASDGSVQLRWSNAGHPPPVLVTPDGTVRLLEADTHDALLSGMRRPARRDHVTTLPTGSSLLLYTDGLVEQRGKSIDEGLDELVDAVGAHAAPDVEAFADGVLEAMMTDRSQDDDVALLVVRIG